MRVLICGGGIGGLTTALALERVGMEVLVCEAAAEIRALGVGINLLPSAVRVLTELGLGEALAAAGIATAELLYFNKHGQRIWQEPRGMAAGYRWPQYSIHRGRLQMLMLEAVKARLGAGAVRVGQALRAFEQDADGVTAVFAGEHRERGDVLIGADGIHSVVRRAFYPEEGEPRPSGRLLWRAVTEAEPFLTGRSMIMAGHAEQKFVAYPICPEAAARGRSLVNWIAELNLGEAAALPKRDWNRRGEKSAFAPAFAGWRFPWLDVPALIGGAAEVYEFPMVDRDPVARWTFGRVTLLGDAAHPMYPVGSNGASQAILDAAALAAKMALPAEEALREYERERRGPTAAIVESNRRMGPEVVMQMAEERAPGGFARLGDVFAEGELEQVAERYRVTAGFDRAAVNR